MSKLLVCLMFLLPTFASADLVKTWPMINGGQLGEFNINGTIIWQVILGAIVTPATASELPLKEQIVNYIKTMSAYYGTDTEFMLQLAGCESGFQPDVYNDHEPKGGVSWGLFQWQTGSWNTYNKLFKTELDRKIWLDQVKLTAQVLKKYGSGDWINCTKYIRRGDNFIK